MVFTKPVLLAMLSVMATTFVAGSTAPHIIYFLVDDMGYADIGYHQDDIKTPTIDKLAEEGMILENNYVASVCTPSRGALMTGKFSWEIGQQHNVLQTTTPDCLTTNYTLIQEGLQNLNYRTYLLGKWHEGYCKDSCTPRHRGFDEFHGFYNGFISHFEHKIHGYYDFWRNEEKDTENHGRFAATVFGESATGWIDDHAKNHADKSMYMYFAFPTIHTPVEAPQEYLDEFDGDDRQGMKAMIKVTDDIIGDVVQALKDNDMYDNSVIIFSSDNGGEATKSLNKPLRGGKASIFEGGVRVPAFIHSPMMTDSKGTVSNELFHQVDWYPTIMSLAGGQIAANLNGYDQTDFLLHGKSSERDVVPIHYDENATPFFGKAAVRKGKWKLIQGFPGMFNGYDSSDQGLFLTHTQELEGHLSNRRKRGSYSFDWAAIGKYIHQVAGSNMLFDLEADPTETTNVAEDNPEVVAELSALIDDMASEVAIPTAASAIKDVTASDPNNFGGFWSSGWC